MTWFASPDDAGDPAGRGRLPRRPGDRDHGVPRRRAREAAARRGPGGRRQDRARQGGGAGDRRRPGPAAVLRGARRGPGALRVELQEAAAADPGRRATTRRWSETHDDIFTEEFLLTRPLLTAIRREEPTVLLIDEVDKTDVEVEGLLLEVLSRLPGDDPRARHRGRRTPPASSSSPPTRSRELSEALKRRCLYLHLDYPDAEREREIVLSQVPDLEDRVAEPAGRDRRPAARARAEEGAVDRGVRRLGAHPDRAGDPATSTTRRSTTPSASCSSTPPTRSARSASCGCASRPMCSGLRRPAHRLPRGAARRRAVRSRWPRTSTRSRRSRPCRWDHRGHRPRRRTPPRWSRSRPSGRPSTTLFDVYFPRAGRRGRAGAERRSGDDAGPVRDNAEALAEFREQLLEALAAGDEERLARLAVEMVGRFGAMPGRGPGLSSWSAYTALQRVAPPTLVDRIVAGAAAPSGRERGARPRASPDAGSAPSPGWSRPTPGAGSPRRRVPTTSPTSRSKPSIDRLDFTAAPQGRPGGDAPRDLPAGPPAGDPADPGAPRPPARPARLPAYRPGLDLDRRRPARHPPPAEAARTAPSWSCSATSAARSPTSRSSRCCSSSRCATSSRRCGRSPSSTTCTR